jgi:hypothetical protein
MWIFFRPVVPIMRIEASLSPESQLIRKQNLRCFRLDLKTMYRIPIWQGNLLAANVAHAYNDTDLVFQSSSLDVQKFSKYLIPVPLL